MQEQKDCGSVGLLSENMPLVTIAIPAYKTEFLSESIGSALGQSYTNVEIIVVDDCSPNDVKSVIDGFSDERLTYYRNEINVGSKDPSRNWQICLNLAKGDYICILCDDDFYGPEFIWELIKLTKVYPSCFAFRSGLSEVDEYGRVNRNYPLAPEHECVEEYILHYFCRNNHQTMSEWMMKTSSLKAIGGFVACPMAWGADCSTVYHIAKQGGVVTSPCHQAFFRYSHINISGSRFKFIPQKVLGWQNQCDTAGEIINVSSHPDKKNIIGVIKHERKHELRKLFKYASVSDLCLMVGEFGKYRLSKGLFVIFLIMNPIWHTVAKMLMVLNPLWHSLRRKYDIKERC